MPRQQTTDPYAPPPLKKDKGGRFVRVAILLGLLVAGGAVAYTVALAPAPQTAALEQKGPQQLADGSYATNTPAAVTPPQVVTPAPAPTPAPSTTAPRRRAATREAPPPAEDPAPVQDAAPAPAPQPLPPDATPSSAPGQQAIRSEVSSAGFEPATP